MGKKKKKMKKMKNNRFSQSRKILQACRALEHENIALNFFQDSAIHSVILSMDSTPL